MILKFVTLSHDLKNCIKSQKNQMKRHLLLKVYIVKVYDY